MPSDVFKALENIELAAFLPKVRSDLAGKLYQTTSLFLRC